MYGKRVGIVTSLNGGVTIANHIGYSVRRLRGVEAFQKTFPVVGMFAIEELTADKEHLQ